MGTLQNQVMELLHPLLLVPAVAAVMGVWWENGRSVGYILQFPDGHRACLTFAEVAVLQEGGGSDLESDGVKRD